jgi:glutathione reductase (NADPH)
VKFDFDLFVVGAGSGGVRAARIAAQYGARVAVAEEFRVGGTCVIRGCVPKKLLVYASKFAEDFEDARGFGWSARAPRFDWPSLIAAKDTEIDRLNAIYIRNLDAAGVEIFNARAELIDRHTIALVGLDKQISAERILIATGGAPFMDDTVGGIEHAITSNEAFHLEQFPDKVIVVGGGYIAVEFAGIFNGLGAHTTLIYRREEILRGFDDDIRAALHQEMAKKGVDIITEDVIIKIEKGADGLTATTKAGRQLVADEIMYAIGRNPNTAGMGLENAGVELDRDGGVKVDGYSQTSVDNIYAVGDVTNRIALTPVAIREGHAFADTVYGDKPTRVDHADIATAVFSQPEIGTVGLSEAQALAQTDNVDIYQSSFRPMKHTLSGRDEKMLLKVVVDGDNDRVLGCHILGSDAGEMAQLLGIAIKMKATKADFDATMAVHPTAAEELVTMRVPTRALRG